MTAVPTRRASGHLAGLAGTVVVFAGAVIGTARLGSAALLVVVGAVQLLLFVGWFAVTAPPGPRGVAVVAVATAIGADALAAFGPRRSLGPLAGILALSVAATMLVQLARGVARARVTEAMAATLVLGLAAISLASLLVLARLHGGPAVVIATALAAGTALITDRCVDLVLPVPHVSPGVDRGGLGIVFGSMVGTAVSAYYAATVPVLTPRAGAVLGWAVALVAVLSDLGASYALVSAPRRPAYSFVAGPLIALTATAPVAYLLGLLVIR